jgi:hypothetical protein
VPLAILAHQRDPKGIKFLSYYFFLLTEREITTLVPQDSPLEIEKWPLTSTLLRT